MTRTSCRRFEERLDDYRAGGLDHETRVALEAHANACAPCRQALALWSCAAAEIREMRPEPLPPLVERRFIVRALAARSRSSAPPARAKLWPAFAAAAATVAVAVGAFVAIAPADLLPFGGPRAMSVHVPVTESVEDRAIQMPDGRSLVHLDPSTDVWLAPGTDLSFERAEADDVRIALGRGRLIADIGPHAFPYRFVVAVPSGEVEAKGTIFSVEIGPDGAEIVRVLRGVVELRPTGSSSAEGASFLVYAGQEGVVGDREPHAVARADLRRDLETLLGRDTAEVAEWLAAADSRCGDLAPAAAGTDSDEGPGAKISAMLTDTDRAAGRPRAASSHSAGRTAALPVEGLSTASAGAAATASQEGTRLGGLHADELIELALAQRQSGHFGTAAATYRQLILEYEGTLESLNALVSLGQLELYNLGRAAAAAAHFESYIQRTPDGILAEEARLGLVRAYDRANRIEDIERAATAYLRHHPRGYAAAEVTRIRADERRLVGNCAGAREDYTTLLSEWPSSKQAKSAEALAEKCGAKPE